MNDALPSGADNTRWPLAYGCLFSLALSLVLWAAIGFGAAQLIALAR